MNHSIDRYQISLKVFLKNDAGKTLILKSADNCSYAGFYDFPGGRIDESEFRIALPEIVRREVLEEIGSDVQFSAGNLPVALGRHEVDAQYSDGETVHVMYLFFEAQYEGGDIQLSPEHQEFQWAHLADLDLEKYFKSGILEAVRQYINQ